METINHYFPELTERQREQFAKMFELYPQWNEKINVISRKDIDNLEVNHILHSLSIVRYFSFEPGVKVLDLGTGGGFPALPLAVYYPDVSFHLVDRVGKKLRVAQDVADKLGLSNVTIQHGDVREVKGTFDYVVSRAVMPLNMMVPLVRKLVNSPIRRAFPAGIICLKGGDLADELRPFAGRVIVDELSANFNEPFFVTKKIVYFP